MILNVTSQQALNQKEKQSNRGKKPDNNHFHRFQELAQEPRIRIALNSNLKLSLYPVWQYWDYTWVIMQTATESLKSILRSELGPTKLS